MLVTGSSVEVCINSQEADYDTFFMACQIYEVISWVLWEGALMCEISSSQYAIF